MSAKHCHCGASLGIHNKTGNCARCVTRGTEKPVPDDFHQFAGTSSNADLFRRYHVGAATVSRWRREAGIPSPQKGGGVTKQIPTSFRLVAPTMTRNQLYRHFKCGVDTIDRWCRELCIKPAPSLRGASARAKPKSAPMRRDDSTVGRAADYLRRYGPVIRCDPRGSYDPNGGHWRRGSTVLAPQEVIERAQRLGWAA